jgi:thymidylate synthase ThyX
MKVILAGYNVDTDLIEKLKKKDKVDTNSITPETISAAYARISRNPADVNILREVARSEIEKARKSNELIVFGLGHSSVAEHACFNFDIIGISRYALEFLENFRLASYTEKSQRYIKIDDDVVLPKEFTESPFKELFFKIIAKQNNFYNLAYEKIKETYINEGIKEKDADLTAKEDARYALSLAIKGQLGMTVNGRTLENMIQKLQATDLDELQVLSKQLYNASYPLAPSLIKYTKPENFHFVKNKLKKSLNFSTSTHSSKNNVRLHFATANPDEEILASVLFTLGNMSYEQAREQTSLLPFDEKKKIFLTIFKDLKSYHSVLREFENATFSFEATMSATAFAQAKRHRIGTIIKQDYLPALGVTIPESFKAAGLEDEFLNLIGNVNEVYYRFKDLSKDAANYLLTNSHRRRVNFTMNARELYHFFRMREDIHAQWDIREIAKEVLDLVKKKAPLTFLLACGKHRFDTVYNEVFNE